MLNSLGFIAFRKTVLAAFAIGLASCGGGGGGGSSTPRFAVSSGPCSNGVVVGTLFLPMSIAARTSGNIPLAVFFDATGTTSGAQPDAFAGIYYSWDFGDTNAGSWGDRLTGSPGSGANLSRNVAYGPLAAHVFEAAGTYTVTLTAFDGTNTASCTIPIAASDWANDGNTACVSMGTNFTGCPSSAFRLSNQTDFATALSLANTSFRKRVLFRCGETWTGNAGYNLTTAGPGLVGAYNDNGPVTRANALCAAPKVTVATTDSMISVGNNVSDWRIVDLEFDGGAGIDSRVVESALNSPSSFITILRLNAHFINGIYVDSVSTTQGDDNWMVQDTSITDHLGVAIWAEHQPTNLALLGNKFWDSLGEHNVRVQGVRKFVMNHNSGRNAGTATSGSKENFTVRESDQSPSGTGTVQWVVSSDNRTDSTRTGAANGGYAAQTIDGVVVDAIFERNFYVAGTIAAGFFFNGPQALATGGPADRVTIRNNVFQGTVTGQANYGGISGNNDAMTSGGLSIFNNTVYSGSVGTQVVGIDLANYDGSHVKNNLVYAPNTAVIQVLGGGTNNDASKNTLVASDDPHFFGPLSTVVGFKPTCVTPSTYPCGQGTATPLPGVWKDLLQVNQPSPTDLGAIVH